MVLDQLLTNLDAEPNTEADRAARKSSLISAFPIPHETSDIFAFAERCVAAYRAASARRDAVGKTVSAAWKSKVDLSVAILRQRKDEDSAAAADALTTLMFPADSRHSMAAMIALSCGAVFSLAWLAAFSAGVVFDVAADGVRMRQVGAPQSSNLSAPENPGK